MNITWKACLRKGESVYWITNKDSNPLATHCLLLSTIHQICAHWVSPRVNMLFGERDSFMRHITTNTNNHTFLRFSSVSHDTCRGQRTVGVYSSDRKSIIILCSLKWNVFLAIGTFLFIALKATTLTRITSVRIKGVRVNGPHTRISSNLRAVSFSSHSHIPAVVVIIVIVVIVGATDATQCSRTLTYSRVGVGCFPLGGEKVP